MLMCDVATFIKTLRNLGIDQHLRLILLHFGADPNASRKTGRAVYSKGCIPVPTFRSIVRDKKKLITCVGFSVNVN